MHTHRGAGYCLLYCISDANVKKRKRLLLLLLLKKKGGYWKNNKLQNWKNKKDCLKHCSRSCNVTQFSTGFRNLKLLISVFSGVIL